MEKKNIITQLLPIVATLKAAEWQSVCRIINEAYDNKATQVALDESDLGNLKVRLKDAFIGQPNKKGSE